MQSDIERVWLGILGEKLSLQQDKSCICVCVCARGCAYWCLKVHGCESFFPWSASQSPDEFGIVTLVRFSLMVRHRMPTAKSRWGLWLSSNTPKLWEWRNPFFVCVIDTFVPAEHLSAISSRWTSVFFFSLLQCSICLHRSCIFPSAAMTPVVCFNFPGGL